MRLQNLILAVIWHWGKTHHIAADYSLDDPGGDVTCVVNHGTILPREQVDFNEEDDFPLELPHRDIGPNEEEDFYDPQSDFDRNSSFMMTDISMTDIFEGSRKLSAKSSTIGTFHPLACNNALANAPCNVNKVSENLPINGNPLIVSCGDCYYWDMDDSDYTLAGGMNIEGKLLFPPNTKVTIRTPYVIVQGELEIKVNHAIITPANEGVVFNITGTDDVKFKAANNPNTEVCAEQDGEQCNFGPKPFIVAGGKLSIEAFPSSCKTHTPILRNVLEKPVKDPNDFPMFEKFPLTCPQSGEVVLVKYSFNDDSVENWTGFWGAQMHVEDNALKVTNRQSVEQGPTIDISPLKPQMCLEPVRDYLFSVRIKLDRADGTKIGEPSYCKTGSPDNDNWWHNCPRLTIRVGRPGANNRYDTLLHMSSSHGPNYGEWVDWTGVIHFKEEHLWQNSTWTILQIDRPEPGTDITIDNFKIALPKESSYPNPNDVCGELVMNGDAEGNGFNPFPTERTDSKTKLDVLKDENNNNYFALKERTASWSSMQQDLDPNCMDVGVVYETSAKVRLHSEYDEKYYWYIGGIRSDGESFYRTILQCPPQKYEDGFVRCSGKFTVDKVLAEATDLFLRMRINGDRDKTVDIDYDDVSIQFSRGYINKFVVSKDDAVCWGEDSEIHVGTSLYYSWNSEVPNGFTSGISNVQYNNDGTMEFRLKDPPHIPVISFEDSNSMAAQVALISRNVKIAGDIDEVEDNKGAYLQVLHTPNQQQKISGIQFVNMGRRGEVDRFPIQFLYSGSLHGTDISVNSIYGSHQRCIVLAGTGNVTIASNVAVDNRGNCIDIGPNAADNKIKRNYVSNTMDIPYIQGARDHHASGFQQRNGPNDYVGNIAVGNEGDGFYFDNDYKLTLENGTAVNVYPRGIKMGTFSKNEAIGNAHVGMRLYHHEQQERIIFEDLKIAKSRHQGLFLYSGRRATISQSVIVGNGYGIEMRWCDEMEISNTEIGGISDDLKSLVDPAYYNHPCASNNFQTPIGYRMHTAIHRFGHKYADGTESTNRGASLSNVNFLDFDHNDACEDSVPIEFNTADKYDGHWNYVSSFEDVQFESNNIMNAQKAIEGGVPDIVIIDVDGSSDPAKIATGASAFVTDKPQLTAFASGCTSYPHTIAYCEGSCLRTVSLYFDQTDTKDYFVKFTNQDGKEAFGLDMYRYDDDAHLFQYEDNARSVLIPLPSGKYKVEFLYGNELVWPKHVYEKWDGKPKCNAHANGPDLSIVEPPIEASECDNLIANGDMEMGTKFWYHRNSGSTSKGALVILPNAGRGGTAAIANVNRTRFYDGPGQQLDTRCFHQNEDQYYEINVWFRLENNAVPFICDKWERTDELLRCPEVTIKNTYYNDPSTKEDLVTRYDHKGFTVMPNDSSDFNLIHGVVKVTERMSRVQQAWIYAENAHKTLDYIIDDFSLTKIHLACNGEFARNGDLEHGRSVFWHSYGSGEYNIIDVGSTKAIEVKNKSHDDHGLLQTLYVNPDCLKEHDRFTIMAKFRLRNSQGIEVACNRTESSGATQCGELRVDTHSPLGNRYEVVSPAIAIAEDVNSEWGKYAGIYTLTGKERNFTDFYLRLSGTDKDTTVIYDDITMEPLPRNCDNMVLNHSFEGGDTSFWKPTHPWVIYHVVKGVSSGTGEYALQFQREQASNGHYVFQDLDSRCFEEGQKFEIRAFFKIIDSSSSDDAMICDIAQTSTSNPEHCPYIYMAGIGCDDGNVSVNLWNERSDAWLPGTFNEFLYDFPVGANLASCTTVRVGIGRGAILNQKLLIDSVSFGHQSTYSPTKSPTYQPTAVKTVGPTPSPTILTNAPTTSVERTCPSAGSTATQLAAGTVMIGVSAQDTVCTLTMVTMDGSRVVKSVPLARSYNGDGWEVAGGDIASKRYTNGFLCYSQGCQIDLPALDPDVQYHLASYSHSLNRRDEMARFLETATFGGTSTEIEQLTSSAKSLGNDNYGAIVEWFKSQSDNEVTSLTSHRKFWRERVSPRIPTATNVGSPDHACDQDSRWRSFAFVRNDFVWWMRKELHVKGSGPYTLFLDGVLRTSVENFWLKKNETYSFDPDFAYIVCRSPEEKVGGRLWITLEDGICEEVENPAVSLKGIATEATYILDLLQNNLRLVDVEISQGGDYLLNSELLSNTCDGIPKVPDIGDEPIFGKVSDDMWLQFDPRLELGQNTFGSPLPDGGKRTQVGSGGASYCSNVPRNFWNEDKCELSSNACQTTSAANAVEVFLNNKTISELNNLVTGRFVYTIKGVNVVDKADESMFPTKLAHPCTPELRSRWLHKENCNPTQIYSGTNASLQELLGEGGDSNPYIRDIYFPEIGMSCNSTDTNPEIEIEVDGQCWQRVHGDFMSIYDMTYWVGKHPGGPDKITAFADNNGTTLTFPNAKGHTMDRWETNKQKFTYLGRFGDFLKIQDLSNELRTENVTNYFDPPDASNSGVLVCGSYGEVANIKKAEGFVFDTSGTDFSTASYNAGEDKMNVWYMVALTANDQLRQRIAWAISQIVVVVTGAVNDGTRHSEWFLSYYDIFVRNAFGNYRDILREISYNPLMAENLSYLQSRSSGYVWERYRVKTQADENFAREIMQLFTMGINKLNMDGTFALDGQNKKVLAYTNDDIESFARAWTGFDVQPRRSNIEGRDNRLDPMRIVPSWRDRFPKTDSAGGYIGDRYLKCEDLPKKAFLKEGATYRFLGNSPLPELMSDPNEFAMTDDSINRVFLTQDSPLRTLLCNSTTNTNCNFQNTVTLPSSVNDCGDGLECNLDTIRVVQVANDAYYEYVQEPCVNYAFYPNAKKISPYYGKQPVMCANPALPDAAEACCEPLNIRGTADRNSRFDGERMIFDSARERCAEVSKEICNFYQVNGPRHKKSMYFWTADDCNVQVRVKRDGAVAIVHQIADVTKPVVLHVDENNENYFRVHWQQSNSWPKANTNLCGHCEVVSGDQCLCNVQLRDQQVFSEPPASIEEALRSLTIGAPNPNIYAAGSFASELDPNTGIKIHIKNGRMSKNTVFELTDDKGRHFFLKNSRETIYVNGSGGEPTGFSFRNAPHFMSFVPAETTLRAAQYETEATLDHYFYHDNTAPFLAQRMIQRLGSSNPSPRYVLTVAMAFKEGRYTAKTSTFGNGKYGDLRAFFAAIYLDREARSIVLDADPSMGSLREPIIKLLSVLRSMEFSSNSPVTRFSNLITKIGQTSHSFESVFSFFLPEFKPSGRVEQASLTSPEATLLDMPRIVGILNGLQSTVKYGLTSCEGGFGTEQSCRRYLPSPSGTLEYGKNDPTFTSETFEGPSLIGGLDNTWVGRDYRSFSDFGEVVEDPISQTNHVYRPLYNSVGRIFSPSVSRSENAVVKFQYFATVESSGGCIGYTTDEDRLLSSEWVYCDANTNSAPNVMRAVNNWITCQFVVPSSASNFRIVIGNRANSAGSPYFDNVTIGSGSETTCTGVAIGTLVPPGKVGFSTDVVDALATLLTAGRLSPEHRDIIRGAYDKELSADDGLKIAQQLVLTTAEFHTTNVVKSKDTIRPSVTFPPATQKPYRAVVYMMFSGGCDSFNMLTPYQCTKADTDLYEEYLDVRQQVALTKQDLLPIDASDQVCETFGVHRDLEAVHNLYNDEDLLFFANTGVMSQPVNKQNYNQLTTTQLFAHNHMQRETKRVDPYDEASGTGVLGRMADILNERGHNVGSFSVDRYSVALVGEPGASGAPMIVNRNGVPDTHLDDTTDYLASLHKETDADSGYFGETWSASLIESLGTNQALGNALQNTEVGTDFPDSYLARQLKTVARLIATRETRGVDTDTFYVETGGFDMHANVEEDLSNRFIEVNEGIEAFVVELKRMGVWNNVTTIQTSDFARTLNPNGGDGTDHAWGGNYMMFGGSVKGGKILGEYPDDLTDEGPLTLGRGRMIPSTPWDAVFKGIAGWLGVPNNKMSDVLPNLNKFGSFSFDVGDMFDSVPPPSPSKAPTPSPKTDEPTSSPSKAPVLTGGPTKRTNAPTDVTSEQTKSPSPTNSPSNAPVLTGAPTKKTNAPIEATSEPTKSPLPTNSPSNAPVLTGAPTKKTNVPTKATSEPTKAPFAQPDPTAPPSSYPTFSPTCFDNSSYLFKRNDSKDCAWAGKKAARRCWKYDGTVSAFVFHNCRKACGMCSCRDANWMYKGNPEKKCAWVKKNTGKRCNKPGAAVHCKGACGKSCCKDDPTYRQSGVEKRSCDWAALNVAKRCFSAKDPDGETKKSCPKTCGLCLEKKNNIFTMV